MYSCIIWFSNSTTTRPGARSCQHAACAGCGKILLKLEVKCTAREARNMNYNSWTIFDLEMCLHLQGLRLQRERFWRPDGLYPLLHYRLAVYKVYHITVQCSSRQFLSKCKLWQRKICKFHDTFKVRGPLVRHVKVKGGQAVRYIVSNVICINIIWRGLPPTTYNYLFMASPWRPSCY